MKIEEVYTGIIRISSMTPDRGVPRFKLVDVRDQHRYIVGTYQSAEDLEQWYRSFKPGALKCAKCSGIIFPHFPVVRNKGKLFHAVNNCCDRNALVGYADEEGGVNYLYPDQRSEAEQTFHENRLRFVEIKNPTLNDFPYNMYGFSDHPRDMK